MKSLIVGKTTIFMPFQMTRPKSRHPVDILQNAYPTNLHARTCKAFIFITACHSSLKQFSTTTKTQSVELGCWKALYVKGSLHFQRKGYYSFLVRIHGTANFGQSFHLTKQAMRSRNKKMKSFFAESFSQMFWDNKGPEKKLRYLKRRPSVIGKKRFITFVIGMYLFEQRNTFTRNDRLYHCLKKFKEHHHTEPFCFPWKIRQVLIQFSRWASKNVL